MSLDSHTSEIDDRNDLDGPVCPSQDPPVIELPSVTEGKTLSRDAVNQETIRLYEEIGAGLLRYAMALIRDHAAAEDALQETFLRFFVFRSEGKTVDNEKAWLYRVLRNYLLDRMKAAGEKNKVDLEEIAEWADHRHNPEANHRRNEAMQQMEALLSPRELECLRLKAEGFDYTEMARILEVQMGTIGATLARALKKIRANAGNQGTKAVK